MSDVPPDIDPDDDDEVVDDTPRPSPAPVAEVASADALPDPSAEDEDRQIDIRGRMFDLVAELPGQALIDLAQAQKRLDKASRPPDDADPASPAVQRWNRVSLDLTAIVGDTLRVAVVPAQRDDLHDHLLDADPPIGFAELTDIMSRAVAKASARPTKSA